MTDTRAGDIDKHNRLGRDGTVIVLALLLALTACSPAATAPATTSMQGSPPPAPTKPADAQALRVVVKFRRAVPFLDAAFLRDMGRQIRARVAYISSVAPDIHAYRIEPEPGQSHADILQRLAGLPSVLRVEADAVARPS